MKIGNNSLKTLVWVHCEIKTPPFSKKARIKAGELLALLQLGTQTKMPHFRVMPSIGSRCVGLRFSDARSIWRIVCFVDKDEIAVLDVFQKKTNSTPKTAIERCKQRLQAYKRI